MAGFLYFKPQWQKPVTLANAKEWGLSYAFSERIADCRCLGNSPSGEAGATFADPTRLGGDDEACELKMDLARQTWGKIPRSDLWVGFWNEHKPKPTDLARMPQLPGYAAKLADGNFWNIPLVRRFDTVKLTTESNLPCYMRVDESGKWQRASVMEIHAHLWEVTTPIADALVAEYTEKDSHNLSDDQIFECVTSLLTTNYVVGPGELSVLQALSTEASTHAACMVACDWPTFIRWSEEQAKKKSEPTAVGSTTSAGDKD